MADNTLYWYRGPSTLSLTELRLARLAHNFYLASTEYKAQLSFKPPIDVLQRLLEPLIDRDLTGEISGNDGLDDYQDLSELFDENRVKRRRSAEAASRNVNFGRLAMMFKLDQKSVQFALRAEGKLRRLSFLQQTKLADLEDFLIPDAVLVQARSSEPKTEEELLAVSLETLSAPATNVHDVPHLSRQADLLQSVLGEANRRGQVGVNALFYGFSGTGKTEFAKALSASLGVSAYSVKTMNADGEPLSRADRLSSYQVAQALIGSWDGELLIFGEVEDLQSSDELMLAAVSGYAPSRDKGWLNRVLETNPVPAIWSTNHLRSLDPAARRRFLVPVEFKAPPRSVRRGIAAGMLTPAGLSETLIDRDPLQSVILLDEVDSFLAERSAAERKWERTMVNELLQQMERYTGVFVAATNLMSGLDPAAMRRFDLKLLLGELTRKQRYRRFAREALGDDHAEVPETTKRLLDSLEGLTLGDVANVQRQRHVLDEARSPEHFVRRLRAEWDLKKQQDIES